MCKYQSKGEKKQKEICNNLSYQSPINIITSNTYKSNELITLKYNETKFYIVDTGINLEFRTDEKNNYVEYREDKWYLDQFHFHNPSENQIDENTYPLELHLVHYNKNKQILVLGFFIEESEYNDMINDSFQNIHQDKTINIKMLEVNGFYSFDGSLTTPPYVEGVQWILAKNKITFDTSQIQQFKKYYEGNIRKIQANNGRIILDN